MVAGTAAARAGATRSAREGLEGIPESSANSATSGNGRFLRSLSSGKQDTANGGPAAQAFMAGSWPSAAQEALGKAVAGLAAKDFRERTDALRAIDGLASALPSAPDAALVQAFDGLVGRMGDANAKVNILALETLGTVVTSLSERTSVGLNSLVPALAANLGSTNDKVRSVASRTADALLSAVDPALLVQNFSHCVSNGHLRGKPAVVEKLCGIVMALHPVKPHLVAKYAVPAALSLLNEGKGESKAAGGQLLGTLAGERMMHRHQCRAPAGRYSMHACQARPAHMHPHVLHIHASMS